MSTTPSDDSSVSFSDYLEPTLVGGIYTIEATQTIEGPETNKTFPPKKQQILVRAPQFSLEPQEIHTHYPAHEAVEEYATHLPYIVLAKRALPWERTLNGSASPPIPWMALMVFTEEEVSPPLTMNVGAFFTRTRTVKSEDTPPVTIHAFVPERAAFQEEDDAAACHCIEVPLDVFTGLVPRLSELPCLAHTRTVAMANKADVDMPHQGAFSIVLANRLPTPGKKHRVHLVSLQGCERYVKEGFSAGKEKVIRLISLAGWSFECAQGADSFKKIVGRLIQEKEHLVLRLHRPAPDPTQEHDPQQQAVQAALDARLKRGFVPLPFHVMDGRDSFAWYRGPLTPVSPAAEPREQAAFLSASSAMAFDEATGVFDLSGAVAWQLGRLLALADPAFAVVLMDLRRRFHHALDTLFDQLKDRLIARKTLGQHETATLIEGGLGALVSAAQDALGHAAYASETEQEAALSQHMQALFGKTAVAAFGEAAATLEGSVDYAGASALADTLLRTVASTESDTDTDHAFFSETEAEDTAALRDAGPYVDQFDHFLTFIDPEPKEDLFNAAPSDPNRAVVRRAVEDYLLTQNKAALKTLVTWLNALSLLDIPFYYVLPHPRLLPAESLRFFHVDHRWWYALYDGALSLGLHARIDAVIYHILKDYLRHPEHLNTHLDLYLANRADQWGLLLRSKLVKAWSGVEFYAYLDAAAIEPVVTRKIGDDLLLFLFDKKPDTLIMQTPKEGLRFALTENTEKEKTRMHLTLKEIKGGRPGKSTGTTVTVPFRQKDASEPTDFLDDRTLRVIHVDELRKRIDPEEAPNAAALAIHLIDTSDRFILTQ